MGFSLTMCSTAASTSPSSFQLLVFRFSIHREFEPFKNKSSRAHSSFQDYQVSSSGITDDSPYEKPPYTYALWLAFTRISRRSLIGLWILVNLYRRPWNLRNFQKNLLWCTSYCFAPVFVVEFESPHGIFFSFMLFYSFYEILIRS